MEFQIMEAARLIKAGLDNIADEIRASREAQANSAGSKINEFNLKQLEAMTSGGIVGVSAMPGPGPRKLS